MAESKEFNLEAMFKSLQELLKNNNEQLKKTIDVLKASSSELKEQIYENNEQIKETRELLTAKLSETNTGVEALDSRVQQLRNEQAVKIENKLKERKIDWMRELKENFKQISEHLNERLRVSKQEQDMKIKEVKESLRENTGT